MCNRDKEARWNGQEVGEGVMMQEKSTLTMSEVEMLIASAAEKSERDALIISLMGKCGLKTGEVRGLKAKHVHDEEPQIRVGERRLEVPEEVYSKLAKFERGYIFKGRKRKAITHRQVQNIVACHSIPVLGRKLTPNDLRRAFANHQVKTSGLDEVRKALGHANASTTKRLLDE